ncbi:hypothetical protein [Tortoise microvirus 81]|nr:hypothetical protein [Tortoise microvirus 81]
MGDIPPKENATCEGLVPSYLSTESCKMETIIHEVVAPVARRVGTVLGSYLAGYGVADADISSVIAGFVALAGIGADLLIVHLRNRRR